MEAKEGNIHSKQSPPKAIMPAHMAKKNESQVSAQYPITLWKKFDDQAIHPSTLRLDKTSHTKNYLKGEDLQYRVWIMTKEEYNKYVKEKEHAIRHLEKTGEFIKVENKLETNNVPEFYSCQKKISRLQKSQYSDL